MDREPSASGRTTATTPAVGTAVITVEIDDFDEDAERRPPRKPRTAKARTAKTRTRPADARRWWQNQALQTAGAAVVVALAVAFIYNLNGGSSVPSISGQPTNGPSQAAPKVDQAKVADLMQQLSANPKDVAPYQALSDLYFQAGDYQTAAEWDLKVLGLDPTNVTGLLSHGASQFNLGNADAAEADWKKVVALNPRQAEAYYDLGFLYLSKNPPEMTKVRQMWKKVVEIDPTSDVAKNVRQHLQGLGK
jgi:tetratricopeptide (TPR) repeat protein